MRCESADISERATIHDSAMIWHLAQVREGAVIGPGVVIGRGAYIGSSVRIGKNSKIQNYAMVYDSAVVKDGVFIGPGVILTNDQRPRAVKSDGKQKSSEDWELVSVTVNEGASIGARAVCVAPVTIGAWSMVGAGAVVVKDIPDFALVVGVPARQIAWVGKSGSRLVQSSGFPEYWVCPVTGERYLELSSGVLVEAEAPVH